MLMKFSRVFDKKDDGCLSDETILRILAHIGDDTIPPEEASGFLQYLKAQVAPRQLKIGRLRIKVEHN